MSLFIENSRKYKLMYCDSGSLGEEGCGTKWEKGTFIKGHESILGGVHVFIILIVGRISRVYIYIYSETSQIVHLNVQFIERQLHLKEADKKQKPLMVKPEKRDKQCFTPIL